MNGTVTTSETLSCTVYGYPLPNVTWYYNDMILELEGNYTSESRQISTFGRLSELTVLELEYEDDGEYWCVAVNNLFNENVVSSNRALLSVHCKLETDFLR